MFDLSRNRSGCRACDVRSHINLLDVHEDSVLLPALPKSRLRRNTSAPTESAPTPLYSRHIFRMHTKSKRFHSKVRAFGKITLAPRRGDERMPSTTSLAKAACQPTHNY